MSDTFQPVANQQASERRFHPRQRVLYSYMQLDGNGGVVLNISESGLAMSAVRSLTEDPLQMRFQLSQSNVWIKARGRIAWMNRSRQTAGVEFIDLPYEGRIQIRRWLSSIGHLSATAKKNPPVEEIAPPARLASATLEPASAVSAPELEAATEVIESSKQDDGAKEPMGLPPIADETEDAETLSQYFRAAFGPETIEYAPIEEMAFGEPASAASESANAVFVPELEATRRANENAERDLVATNPAEVLPDASETRVFETAPQHSRAASAMPAAAENTGLDPRPPLYLSYEDSPPIHAKIDGKLMSSPRNVGQWTGVLVLFLLAFLLLGLYFRRAGINKRSGKVPATASQLALASSDLVIPKNPLISVDSKPPLKRGGFVLQVAAMKSKDNADALAESLRTKHFPAFVSHQGNDHFYFVVVGPYSDVDSAIKADTDLQKEGVESIRTPWNPLAE